MEERCELRLSDAYEKKNENPDLELRVTELNINAGYNEELMKKCKTLREYMILVDRIRRYNQEVPFAEAVECAVDECIEEGILREFLRKNRNEVIKVSIYEYNEERHIQQERDAAWEKGKEAGEKIGEERVNALNQRLIEDDRIEDLKRSVLDVEYQTKLLEEYGING